MPQQSEHKFPFIADMLIMLILCAVTACFLHGTAALTRIAVSVLTCVVCDAAGTLLLRKKLLLRDLSAVVTGLCLAMMLPSSFPLALTVLVCFVAVAAGRLPFGDYDKVPFVPAAVGAAFATLVYPDAFFSYPPVSAPGVGTASLASLLQNGNSVNITVPGLLNILAGNSPGPLGTTCTFLLAACLIYLAIRQFDKFLIALSFTGVCALFAVSFPRVMSGRTVSLLMELGGGMLLFAAVFLMTYPNVRIRSVPFCLLYGGIGGAVCMLIRYFGSFEEGVCFAVLIMNALSGFFEKREASAAELLNGGASDE